MATNISGLNIEPELKKALSDIVTDIAAARSPLAALLTGSETYDAASLVDGAGTTNDVTVTGAVLGDFAMASLGVSAAGITVTAYVSAADTVSVRVQNESGGTLDLASTTLTALVLPKASFVAPGSPVTSA
jgi:hypothetical protein